MFFSDSPDIQPDHYADVLKLCELADASGLSAAWFPERHFHRFGGGSPNPAILAAAVASRTQRISVRAGSVVAPLHDPIRIAEDWALVDQVSGGRAGVALASGWNLDDFVLAPESYAHRKAVLQRCLRDIQELWSGGQVARETPDGRTICLGTLPPAVQRPFPIWLTSSGSDGTFELAGEMGLGVLTHMLGQTTDDLSRRIALYHAKLPENAKRRLAVLVHTSISDSASTIDSAAAAFRSYLGTSFELWAGAAAGISDSDRQYLIARSAQRLLEQSLIGPPEVATARLQELARLGVTEAVCLVDFGTSMTSITDTIRHLGSIVADPH
jgi:natural product biosynthesis luciferase-like monooxygenase protein